MIAESQVEMGDACKCLTCVDAFQLRLGHAAEIAEAANDGFEIGDLHAQSLRTLAEDFVKFGGGQFTRADQIFDGELKWKERILEFMGKAAGQFAPGGYALGLHEPIALRNKFARHVIEASCKGADFVVTPCGTCVFQFPAATSSAA